VTTSLLAIVCSAAAMLVSIIAAVMDRCTGRIPNWLTLPVAVFGVVLHAILGGTGPAGASLLGLVLNAAIPAILYGFSHGRAIGGGDVKLLAALGALLGPTMGLETEFGAFILLAAFALIQLAFRGQLLRVLGNAVYLTVNPVLPRKWRKSVQIDDLTEMRMGPAIATSVMSTLLIEQLNRVFPWLG
jgi:prepilin peptidase CpaA